LLAAAMAFGAAVAGCGGDNGDATASDDQGYSVEADTTMTTANLDKAQFVSRVNKICRKSWPIVVHNFAEYSETQDPRFSKKARFAQALHLSLLAGIDFYIFDGIYNLGAPPGQERQVEEIIGPFQSAVERGQKELVPLSSRAQAVALFDDYNQRARQYGLTDCLVDKERLQEIKA
jgi:hypothetical protein